MFPLIMTVLLVTRNLQPYLTYQKRANTEIMHKARKLGTLPSEKAIISGGTPLISLRTVRKISHFTYIILMIKIGRHFFF
ncbi:hypothetical protein GGI35DRAFT_437714 [Trichoderma velutinum]